MKAKNSRLVRVLSGLAVLIALVATSACSSVPRIENKETGIFQQPNVQITLATMPPLVPEMAKKRSEFGFSWPLREGRLTSLFGGRKRDYHEGIDIRANRGTPIYAARDGEVIYSSRKIRGYGNMIVVKHDEDYATVYAHNRKNLVKRGARVTQGQLLGYVGATGKATGPHLHFEIRKREVAQDPLLFLPQIREPAVASK